MSTEQQFPCPECHQLVTVDEHGEIRQHFITLSHTHRYECSGSYSKWGKTDWEKALEQF